MIKKPSWDPRVIPGARFLAKSGDDVGDGECHPLVFASNGGKQWWRGAWSHLDRAALLGGARRYAAADRGWQLISPS